jgi:hypothetical protein
MNQTISPKANSTLSQANTTSLEASNSNTTLNSTSDEERKVPKSIVKEMKKHPENILKASDSP